MTEAAKCQHNCEEGGVCLAELSGYPESCPGKALELIDFDALGDVLAQYPDSTPITEVEGLNGLSVGSLTVLTARASAFEAQERLIETQEAALRAASNELSRLLFNEPSQTTHKVIEVVDAALASTNGKHRNPS